MRAVRLVPALLALTALGCGGVRARLSQARDRTYAKDWKGAAAAYRDVLIEVSHDESPLARDARAAALVALGDLYDFHLGEPATAAQFYRELAERYPDRPETFDARVHLADILRDHFHDTRAAVAQLAALVQSFPNHLDTDRYQYRAAQDYFELHDYAQTETELKLLLTKYPGTGFKVEAEMLYASSLFLDGRKADAIAEYQRIAENHGGADAARAWQEIGRIYEDAGDWDRAETALAKALADHPEPQVVALALQRIRRRVAQKRPADIHDHAAVFDHKNGQNVAERGE